MRGRDIYAITAPIVVEATNRVVNGLAKGLVLSRLAKPSPRKTF